MNKIAVLCCAISMVLLTACARLEFEDERGLAYYESKPYLLVQRSKQCETTVSIVQVPSVVRHVKFHSGIGSADLKITLDKGMITTAGQNTDTKVSDSLSPLGSIFKTAGELGLLTKGARTYTQDCVGAWLYEVVADNATGAVSFERLKSINVPDAKWVAVPGAESD